MFIPPDNEEARKHLNFDTPSGYWGTCGPAAIAVLSNKSVKEIISMWDGYKGYAPLKDMQLIMKKLGYNVIRKKGAKSKQFPEPTTDAAIIRIQWLQEDGTEFPWWSATQNTHYVLMQKIEGEWWIFCNSNLWFKKESEEGKKYLEMGFVSSYLEVAL